MGGGGSGYGSIMYHLLGAVYWGIGICVKRLSLEQHLHAEISQHHDHLMGQVVALETVDHKLKTVKQGISSLRRFTIPNPGCEN